ncbi:MAG: hypothetical protein ABIC68_01900 [Candidatus Omnitrophota bacterium]
MAKNALKMSQEDALSLEKRYLFWLYKTIRDELDKIDRKFTQLDIDNEIYKKLKKSVKRLKPDASDGLHTFLQEWQEYIFGKDSDAQKLKFKEDGQMNSAYLFLRLKLQAVEEIVCGRFGKKELSSYKRFYEDAAMKRITEDTSGRR